MGDKGSDSADSYTEVNLFQGNCFLTDVNEGHVDLLVCYMNLSLKPL